VYTLAHLSQDTEAALDWIVRQPSVDATRLALVGGSMGGYASLQLGALDARVRAIAAIAPLIDPAGFVLRREMADEFADMLNGVSGQDLQRQWHEQASLSDLLPSLASKRVLLVTADRDDLFPPEHYATIAASLSADNPQWSRAPEGDHGFSSCRSWLVATVTDWLTAQLGA
jgi:dipeptidyl aminopeptidase/acylaminoacyl peptidase